MAGTECCPSCFLETDHLDFISKECVKDWEKLLRKLLVEQHIIDGIKIDYDWSQERAYQGLLHWQCSNPKKAAFCVLAKALDGIDRNDIKLKLEEKYGLDCHLANIVTCQHEQYSNRDKTSLLYGYNAHGDIFIDVACQEITEVKGQINDEKKLLEDYESLKIPKCCLCKEFFSHRVLIKKANLVVNGYKTILITSKDVLGNSKELICHLDDEEAEIKSVDHVYQQSKSVNGFGFTLSTHHHEDISSNEHLFKLEARKELMFKEPNGQRKEDLDEWNTRCKEYLNSISKENENGILTPIAFPPEHFIIKSLFNIAIKLRTYMDKRSRNGAVISSYDSKRHIQFLSLDENNAVEKLGDGCEESFKNRLLLIIENPSVILNIRIVDSTEESEIIDEFRIGNDDLEDLIKVRFLGSHAEDVYIHNVVIAKSMTHKDIKFCCQNCHLITADILNDEKEFTGFLDNLIRCVETQKEIDCFDFTASLIGFISTTNTSIETGDKGTLQRIHLTQEQFRCVFSEDRKMIVEGYSGTGKSLVASYLFGILRRRCEKSTLLIYLVDIKSPNLLVLPQIKNTINTWFPENNNVDQLFFSIQSFCEMLGLDKGAKISDVIEATLKNYENKRIHIFIDEFRGYRLNSNESKKLKILFSDPRLEKSYVAFFARATRQEIEYIEEHDGSTRRGKPSGYQYTETEMNHVVLQHSIRYTNENYGVLKTFQKELTEQKSVLAFDYENTAADKVKNGEEKHDEANELERIDEKTERDNWEEDDEHEQEGKYEEKEQEIVFASEETEEDITIEDEIETRKETEQAVSQLSAESVRNEKDINADFSSIGRAGSIHKVAFQPKSPNRVERYHKFPQNWNGTSISGEKPVLTFFETISEDKSSLIVETFLYLKHMVFDKKKKKETRLVVFENDEQRDMLIKIHLLADEPFVYCLANNDTAKFINHTGGEAELSDEGSIIANSKVCSGSEYNVVIVCIDPEEHHIRDVVKDMIARAISNIYLLSLVPYDPTNSQLTDETLHNILKICLEKNQITTTCIKRYERDPSISHDGEEDNSIFWVNTKWEKYPEKLTKLESISIPDKILEDKDIAKDETSLERYHKNSQKLVENTIQEESPNDQPILKDQAIARDQTFPMASSIDSFFASPTISPMASPKASSMASSMVSDKEHEEMSNKLKLKVMRKSKRKDANHEKEMKSLISGQKKQLLTNMTKTDGEISTLKSNFEENLNKLKKNLEKRHREMKGQTDTTVKDNNNKKQRKNIDRFSRIKAVQLERINSLHTTEGLQLDRELEVIMEWNIDEESSKFKEQAKTLLQKLMNDEKSERMANQGEIHSRKAEFLKKQKDIWKDELKKEHDMEKKELRTHAKKLKALYEETCRKIKREYKKGSLRTNRSEYDLINPDGKEEMASKMKEAKEKCENEMKVLEDEKDKTQKLEKDLLNNIITEQTEKLSEYSVNEMSDVENQIDLRRQRLSDGFDRFLERKHKKFKREHDAAIAEHETRKQEMDERHKDEIEKLQIG